MRYYVDVRFSWDEYTTLSNLKNNDIDVIVDSDFYLFYDKLVHISKDFELMVDYCLRC